MAFLNPRRHSVAVELDLVDPLRAGRRVSGQLGKLRFDPAGERHAGLKRPLRRPLWTPHFEAALPSGDNASRECRQRKTIAILLREKSSVDR
jgi:hypothetical protein